VIRFANIERRAQFAEIGLKKLRKEANQEEKNNNKRVKA
jgi:hypothetical protein